MKKFLTTLVLTFMTIVSFACHTTSITLVSGPTAVGGGNYSTTIQVCFGQYTAGNWGGTQNFRLTLTGANYVSFLPATITNNYNAYTTATCMGPNCFMGTCLPISATATGAIAPANIVTYNTSSSVPAGFPIIPDDNESCAGCPTSFCFNFTFVSNGYPTSISLNGNIEVIEPKVCRTICGFPLNYPGGPCNGSFDADMTITFSPLPIELLYFNGYVNDGFNLLEWTSATETNNDYYTVERSNDGIVWDEITRIKGAGNSVAPLRYTYHDYSFTYNDYNYYRLSQTDFNGEKETFNIIVVNNKDTKEVPTLIGVYNQYGQIVNDDYKGFVIYYYDNGTSKKVIRE